MAILITGRPWLFLCCTLVPCLFLLATCGGGDRLQTRPAAALFMFQRGVSAPATATPSPTEEGRPSATPTPAAPKSPSVALEVEDPFPPQRLLDLFFAPAYESSIELVDPDTLFVSTEFAPLRVVSENTDAAGSPLLDAGMLLVAETTEATDQREVYQRSAVTRVKELEARVLLARIPPLEVRPRQAEPHLPIERARPPQTDDVEALPFPPPEAGAPDLPEIHASGRLQVLRYAPSQDVDMAPNVSITFSRPMVPLTSHSTLAAQDLPVSLVPQPPGEWYWMGTRTLLFQPDGRLPGSTRYRAEIPAGVSAVDGSELVGAVGWEFETERLTLVRSWLPGSQRQPLQPQVALEFNQSVDRQALAPFITIKDSSEEEVPFAVLSGDDPSLTGELRSFLKQAMPERTILLQPTASLSPDARFTVHVAAGAPSAEGPLLALEAHELAFYTYAPLRITSVDCTTARYRRLFIAYPCDQSSLDFIIFFNNELDPESLAAGTVSIAPPLPNGTVEAVHWDWEGRSALHIGGRKNLNTIYTVRIGPGLKDRFGQTLGSVEERTIFVGAPRGLHVPASMEVLNPHNKGQYSLFSYGLSQQRVMLFPLTAADWLDYLTMPARHHIVGDYYQVPGSPGMFRTLTKVMFLQDYNKDAYRNSLRVRKLLGDGPVLDSLLPLNALTELPVQTPLNLNPYLDQGKGHLLMVLPLSESTLNSLRRNVYNDHPADATVAVSWIQATDLGLDTFRGDAENTLIVHATSLATGEPLPDVNLQLQPDQVSTVTNADGYGYFELSDLEDHEASYVDEEGKVFMHWIEARKDWDLAFLTLDQSFNYNSFHFSGRFSDLRWHAFTDRDLYRPGESVQVKGWVRKLGFFPQGDVTWAKIIRNEIRYYVADSRGIEIDSGIVHLDEHGALNFGFTVPKNANAGQGKISLSLESESARYGQKRRILRFNVQGFRLPEFEVSVDSGAGPHFRDEAAILETRAQYYGGGPVAGASVLWQVSGQPTRYAPPGWNRYEFGVPLQKVRNRGADIPVEGELDGQGRHRLAVSLSANGIPATHLIQFEATVQDLSQQTFTHADVALIHPAEIYAGVRTESLLATVEEPYVLTLIVTDVDGVAAPGHELQVLATLHSAQGDDLAPGTPEELPPPRCHLTSASEPIACALTFPVPGLWSVDIAGVDAKGRPLRTQLTRQVIGTDDQPWWGTETGVGQVELTPDQSEYQPGDVARIMVQSPFYPAYGTVITNRSGIVAHEYIEMLQGPTLLSVPIKEEHIPNLHVQVALNGTTAKLHWQDAPVPALAAGAVKLQIPPYRRELTIDLQMEDRNLVPGGTAAMRVQVSDADGKPVPGAEVVLLAVDEAVLALAGYDFDHPLGSFYPHRALNMETRRLRNYMQSAEFVGVPWYPIPRGGGGGGDNTQINAETFYLRADFNPLAVFIPSGITDAQGVFRAAWDVPDKVGRYRVLAMATTGPRLFGLQESSYTASLPIQLRTQWPRYLNFGDFAHMSVLVENQTAAEQDLTLIVQSDGMSLAYADPERTFDAFAFTVPAHSRQQVTVPAQAATAGESQLLAAVFNESGSDATLSSVPVYVPASQEGFAAYGIVEDQVAMQGLQLPTDVLPDFGQLTISTSSTILQSVLDGYLQLRRQRPWMYPELLSCRILANVALRDVLYAFNVPNLPPRSVLDQHVQHDIADLVQFQNGDGGFPMWGPRGSSWPFVSLHGMYALAIARQAGYEVPPETVYRGLDYLSSIEEHISHYHSSATRRYITAFALYVRSQLGDQDPQSVLRLLDSAPPEDHPLEVLAWSLLVLHTEPQFQAEMDAWMEFVLNRVAETTGKASFAGNMREQDGYLILQSDRRPDALFLQALMTLRPQSDLVPKVVQGILAGRTRHGHWGSSQDNVSVLLAMNQYFREYEATQPDFQARLWLDDTLVVDTPFTGYQAARRQVVLPMPWLLAQAPERILIQRAGQGKLYYRLGLDYVPSDLKLDPLERGFTVLRTYAGVDNPADVWQDEDQVWHVKLGARVQIEVTLVAPGNRHHVQLASPLPAGLEFLNPALEGNRASPALNAFHSSRTYNPYHRFYWPWFDHQQLLDERALAVATQLPGGVYRYAMTAQATMAGTFQVPPARAHEVYAPETFGRGPSEVMVVEPG